MLGIIAGSGLYGLETTKIAEYFPDTPYGKPSGPILKYRLEQSDFFFLSRHGVKHTIPPHRVNYRANIAALKIIGVDRIISISAVGTINSGVHPGEVVLGDQILDFTKNRENTFFEGDEVFHIDFTFPYCSELTAIILASAKKTGVGVHEKGYYAAVEGPRLETALEISFLRLAGASIVGMTGMPEAALAREAELCYAGVYIVTNFAAGIYKTRLTTVEVINTMKASEEKIGRILSGTIPALAYERTCGCKNALEGSGL